MAIFVVDQRQRDVGGAQHGQRVHRVHQVRNDRRLAAQRAEVDRLAVAARGETSRVWMTPTIFSIEPSATGMRLCGVSSRASRISSGGRADVDPVDIGARRHDFADRPVGKPDDARNHRPLVFLEHARGLRFGDDQVKLLGGDLVPRFRGRSRTAGR